MFDLKDPKNYQNIQAVVNQVVHDDDLELASKWGPFLKRSLSEQKDIGDDIKKYQHYLEFIKQLKFIRLASLSDKEFDEIMTNDLVTACRLPEFNLADKIGTRISFQLLPEDQVTEMEHIIELLKSSSAALGDKSLIINGKTANPIIRNWMDDYENFPSSSALRTDLDEINYINKSANAQSLKLEDREILLEILKIRDTLQNRVSDYKAIPQASTEVEAFKDFDLYDYIPGVTVVNDDSVSNIINSAMPAKTAAPAIPIVNKPSTQVSMPRLTMPPSKVRKPVGATVNMQDILNRQGQHSGGVVFDNQTNVKVEEMGQRLEAERQDKQEQINKKIDELKKRRAI